MSEKLDNDVFRIKRIDGKIVAGDANKLKLLITSYAVIMEVQSRYMEEEIASMKEEKADLKAQKKDGSLNRQEVKDAKKQLSSEIADLYDSYASFFSSRKRFMDISKKALSLPSENFRQLAEQGWTKIGAQRLNISDFDYSISEARDSLVSDEGENVFSMVDSDAIKQEVERTMNEEKISESTASNPIEETVKDYVVKRVDNKNFGDVVNDIADFSKENLDKEDDSLITPDDVSDIFAKAEELTRPQVMPSVSFDNDNSFDFSNDPEMLELEKQLKETKGLYESSKNELSAKEEKTKKLQTEKEGKKKEAQEKRVLADEIISKAREEAITRMKGELQSLKQQLLATNEQIKAQDDTIAGINSEIAGYQASIDKSEGIINGNTRRTK